MTTIVVAVSGIFGMLFVGVLYAWGRFNFRCGYRAGCDEIAHTIGVRLAPIFAQAGIPKDVVLKAMRTDRPTN